MTLHERALHIALHTKFGWNRKPIHKFNGGKGATLCHSCSVIIKEEHTDDIYCNKCLKRI